MKATQIPDGIQVLSVSELTGQVRGLLEEGFSSVWVEGEISNCKRHGSGHLYLDLKDAGARLKAVIWRTNR